MATMEDADASKVDFYEFLSLKAGPASTSSEIKRAGRKTSLLYHPDKVAPTPENLQNFHILQIAIAVLSDPGEKAKYDQTREAKLRRKAEVEALDARRRKMREDLEAREKAGADVGPEVIKGQKRTYNQRDMDIRRIAEENRRKMELLAAQRRADQLSSQQQPKEAILVDPSHSVNNNDSDQTKTEAETDKTPNTQQSIKLRWIREGLLENYDEQSIQALFPTDDIDHVILLKDKKRRVDGRDKKVLMATAVIGFTSKAAAERAMERKSALVEFESVEWA